MADDLKYGYKGAEPTQSFGNNTGVFDPNDINNLIADNKWTSFGQLELIETQTVSGVSYVDFLDINEDIYNVHFVTTSATAVSSANQVPKFRFYESGVLETASVYQYATQFGNTSATFSELKSTASDFQYVMGGLSTAYGGGAYFYIYNAGDSSKYTFSTQHSFSVNNSIVGETLFSSSVLPQTSVVDGFRIYVGTGTIDTSISLYGIRYS